MIPPAVVRVYSYLVPSKWQSSLPSNDISHWLDARQRSTVSFNGLE